MSDALRYFMIIFLSVSLLIWLWQEYQSWRELRKVKKITSLIDDEMDAMFNSLEEAVDVVLDEINGKK